MKHVVVVRADYYEELEKSVETKIQDLQNAGNDIVDISLGGRGAESVHDWVALILYEDKK